MRPCHELFALTELRSRVFLSLALSEIRGSSSLLLASAEIHALSSLSISKSAIANYARRSCHEFGCVLPCMPSSLSPDFCSAPPVFSRARRVLTGWIRNPAITLLFFAASGFDVRPSRSGSRTHARRSIRTRTRTRLDVRQGSHAGAPSAAGHWSSVSGRAAWTGSASGDCCWMRCASWCGAANAGLPAGEAGAGVGAGGAAASREKVVRVRRRRAERRSRQVDWTGWDVRQESSDLMAIGSRLEGGQEGVIKSHSRGVQAPARKGIVQKRWSGDPRLTSSPPLTSPSGSL